ncbi:endonuclease/exonuclease/phosphatase family protein [Microbacterium sp. zg.Y1090]|uniref:endonuclease/exonuclease/phosphatase family protein n=1 Tax=Microbacterium TaxID=33882 RepID=UPI00214C72D4|nr:MULTISPECIES: endonuclease/exonuclease/phosphatase family protein [unclassified Microbacterium]MCR2814221.1 endonuclease/exonuclease/phosphatase family protein [Microbacterium sp. zg.Y1084]MCR2820007.1 endonuclease/exonuclease/phosphatase family protein [Microbacterium sp. zg.Y1090]MDL5488207.1 endonuclease/exonuclease/phosphatase family protein [Microbacterium sp. zg-Y1211]WIM27978.1 endonuclease/exonuclease/phosphatase family protein [Microbacterium sp. zg-Y1090]
MRLISYNLRKHRAAGELSELVERHAANVLCLQEAVTAELPRQIGGLTLADSTRRNRLGLAVYYRDNTFRVLEARSMSLKKSLHDRVLKPAEERMLGVRLRDIDNNREFIVASFHAAPLTALNSLRRHQIKAALTELADLGDSLPTLMVGDYNYPVFKESLGQKVREHGYELTLSDMRTYTRYKFFRGHYDFATSVGFDIERVTTLPQGRSDHLPILVTATPSSLSRAADDAA